MSSVERFLRCRSPICWGTGLDSEEGDDDDGGEVLDADSNNADGLDEGEDGYFVLSLNCLMVAMFLMRMVDRAAAQSMKAKVAPFHNFILERGGALKLCGESEREAKCATSDMFKQSRLQPCTFELVTLKHRHISVETAISTTITLLRPFHKSTSLEWGFCSGAFNLPPVYFLWFCCQLILTISEVTICALDITRWHPRMQMCGKVKKVEKRKNNTTAIPYLSWRQTGCNPCKPAENNL